MIQQEHRNELILVRPASEVTLKARHTRNAFMRNLASGIRDALQREDVECRTRRTFGRVYASVAGDRIEAAMDGLERVFGVGSFSRVEAACDARMDEIVRLGGELYPERVRGRSFAVRCKRTGRHDFSSVDVERELGAVLAAHGRVDLSAPEVTVRVEVNGDEAHLLGPHRRGPGGLPGNTGGKALALLSGGFDSPVAAWHLLRRGVAPDFVFFNLGGAAYERLVVQVAKVFSDAWCYGYRARLHVVDFAEVLEALRSSTREDYWQVLLKRLMLRSASEIAERIGADALVTGEAVGQVSSQTLRNLRVIDDAAALPVLRPLVGTDKQEIIRLAREIGTEPLSARIREYCAITSRRPVVAADPAIAEREEAKIDPAVLRRALDGAKVVKLRALTHADLVLPYLYTDVVPEGATVFHVQTPGPAGAWRHPGAQEVTPEALRGRLRELDRSGVYVLYCAHGMQSAQLTEVMQQLGYEAYSFRGGAPALERYHAGAPRPGPVGA